MRLLLFVLPLTLAAQPYDLVIRNGHIIDGTGSPWYAATSAFATGRIAAIGHLANAPAQTDHRRRAAWSWRPASSTCSGSRS